VKRDLCERTFRSAGRIVRLRQSLDERAGVARTLGRQLLRSGISIGANVEEGQAGQSRAHFMSKYSIASKEARETHYWLRLLAPNEIVPEADVQDLLEECNQTRRHPHHDRQEDQGERAMIRFLPLHPSPFTLLTSLHPSHFLLSSPSTKPVKVHQATPRLRLCEDSS